MAKKAYDIPIDYRNTVSWSGDKTTENLPLAGSVVEKYIKDNFDHKAGYFYSDGTQGKCFVFANEDAYNRWVASEGKDESEILGSFGITGPLAIQVYNWRKNIHFIANWYFIWWSKESCCFCYDFKLSTSFDLIRWTYQSFRYGYNWSFSVDFKGI